MQDHEETVKRICRYPLKTRNEGLLLKPDKNRGLERHVDADWVDGWTHRSSANPSAAYSRTEYCITYARCPLIWTSRLQPLIALRTIVAEDTALLSTLQ